MSFAYTVTLSDPANSLTSAESAAVIANLRGALEIYSRHLTGAGSVDVHLIIGTTGGDRASGRSPQAVHVGSHTDGRHLAEPGALAELRTGVDPNGPTADVELTLAPDYLRKILWLDPDPFTRAASMPADRFDAVSLFLHELGHAFGLNGWGHESTGFVAGDWVSTYDALVRSHDGKPVFVGTNAVAFYGSALPLSTGKHANYHHYGEDASDGLELGLMQGSTYAPHGFRWFLDGIDLAIFRDLGLNAVQSPIADTGGSRFQGFAAADTLVGGIGADTLDGGSGDDRLMGGDGADRLSDPSGANFLRGEAGDDQLVGGIGFDDLHGNVGNDTVSGRGGPDWVVGGQGQDLLFGDDGDDVVYGNLGDDTQHGGDGHDWVRGGQGNDLLFAGPGNDWIAGDRGDDTITGGAGADLFNTHGAAGVDRILDFRFTDGDRVVVGAAGAYLDAAQYTVSQVGADVYVNMVGGGQLVLVGVNLADLGSGWIMTA